MNEPEFSEKLRSSRSKSDSERSESSLRRRRGARKLRRKQPDRKLKRGDLRRRPDVLRLVLRCPRKSSVRRRRKKRTMRLSKLRSSCLRS